MSDLLEKLTKLSPLRIAEEEFKQKLRELLQTNALEYPPYVNEPWLRIKPHEKYVNAWYEKWIPVIKAYCSKKITFKLAPEVAVKEFPFTSGDASLSEEELREILEFMVAKGSAIKLDGEYLILWLPVNTIADLVGKAAKEAGLSVIRTKILAEGLGLSIREAVLLLAEAFRTGKLRLLNGGLGVKVLS